MFVLSKRFDNEPKGRGEQLFRVLAIEFESNSMNDVHRKQKVDREHYDSAFPTGQRHPGLDIRGQKLDAGG
jgi:hypothetical protein